MDRVCHPVRKPKHAQQQLSIAKILHLGSISPHWLLLVAQPVITKGGMRDASKASRVVSENSGMLFLEYLLNMERANADQRADDNKPM